jgi:hypothetical protein
MSLVFSDENIVKRADGKESGNGKFIVTSAEILS